MILQRATLLQAYDTGTEGSRFNIQQRSIEMLLEHPNGMGPWVFARICGLVSTTPISAFSSITDGSAA